MTEKAPTDVGNPYSTLTTKEGWQAFVAESPVPPPPLAPGIVLDADELESYKEARIDYHTRSVIVATPTIRKVVATGRKRILLNRHQVSARRGLIVSGSPGTGKTTAITQLGKNVEQLIRRRNPRLPPNCRSSSSLSLRPPPRRCWRASSPGSSPFRCTTA